MNQEEILEKLEFTHNALGELGQVLTEESHLEKISKSILHNIMGTSLISKGAIFRYNVDKESLCLIAQRGLGNKQDAEYILTREDRKNIIKYPNIINPVETLDFNEYSFAESLLKKLRKISPFFWIPLVAQKQFLGLVVVGKKFMNKPYSDTDERILEITSKLLAGAFKNIQLIEDLRDKNNQLNLKILELETLHDVNLAITTLRELEKQSEEILAQIVSLIPVTSALILLKDKGRKELSIAVSFNVAKERQKKTAITTRNPFLSKCAKEKKGFIFNDYENGELNGLLKSQHLLVEPMITHSGLKGYLILGDKESRQGIAPFVDSDLELLSVFAAQAAIAIDNANLFKDINEIKKFNESILSSIATGVITFDENGKVTSANPPAEKIFDSKEKELLTRYYPQLFRSNLELLEAIIRTKEDGKQQTELNINLLTDTKNKIVNFSVSPLYDEKNRPTGLVTAIEDITEQDRVKSMFKRYVSNQVVEQLLADDEKLKLGGERREVTVLFSDIRGFTAMSENMEPEEVVDTLNEYFEEMIEIIFKNDGTLDKIVGDELMVVYGAPIRKDDDPLQAVQTAIEMVARIKELNKRRKKEGKRELHAGFGINTGMVVSGNIGSHHRMDYTVIGDTVNLGARLCSAAGAEEIIVSKPVYEKVKSVIRCKSYPPIAVKGKNKKIEIYKIL